MTAAPLVVKDKVLVGISGGEFGVHGRMTAYNIKDGTLAWKAYSVGPDSEIADRPGEDDGTGQAGRRGLVDSRPGRATSGRTAAAPPGAGTPTTRSST